MNSTQTRHYSLLVPGILCYLSALVLYFLQSHITSSEAFKTLSSAAQVVADYVWSIPSAIAIALLLFFTAWLSFQRRKTGEKHYTLQLPDRLPGVTRICLIFLVFSYSLFPLRWAQRGVFRSLQSFPNYTVFDYFLTLLFLAGTTLCYLYLSRTLPLRAAALAERAISSFFRLKQFLVIGTLLAICLVITGVIAYVVLDHIPHVEDSIAQLFQAKIFKMGKLYASLPPHKEFFDYTNIINDDKWYSQYPPGHSFLLMLGLFLRIPWLIGPLLGTLSLYVMFLVVRKCYGDLKISYLSCCLMLLSPFFLFMSSNHMNHSSTLLFLLLFLYFYFCMLSSSSNSYSFFSGLFLGCAINIRPLDGVAIATVFVCYIFYCAFKKREVHSSQIVYFCFGLSLMVCVLLLYNKLTNGNPFIFGYQQKYQSLGFLGNAQFGPPHTLKGGIINTSNNLIGLNQYLFEWPLPSLIFIFIFFLMPVTKKRWDYLFLFSSLIVCYFEFKKNTFHNKFHRV